ncbi:hypothetical protein D3C76_1681400 [compost metagenome]
MPGLGLRGSLGAYQLAERGYQVWAATPSANSAWTCSGTAAASPLALSTRDFTQP